jgi:hypothetical protein
VVALGLLALAAAGCGNGGQGSFAPSEDAARKALDASLAAWQGGMPKPGPIDGATPPVQAVDSRWAKGELLQSYEILQEEPQTGVPRVFSVKLTMKAPAASKTVKYFVVGKEPLWVYREDDYQLPAGM